MISQDSERIATLWFEVMSSKRELSVVDEIVHRDYMPEGISLKKRGPGLAKDEIQETRAFFPDINYEIMEMTALPDRIWVRYKVTGTHKASILGFPPTGNRMESDGVTILYIKDNKIINQWSVSSLYDMLVKLELVPPLWALKDHLHWP